MRTLSIKLVALATTAAMAGVIMAATNNDEAVLNQIAGYRQWTRVTPEPIKVDVPVAIGPITPAILASLAS